MGESSFWYRPTRVVPDQRPLNGRCCCCTPCWARPVKQTRDSGSRFQAGQCPCHHTTRLELLGAAFMETITQQCQCTEGIKSWLQPGKSHPTGDYWGKKTTTSTFTVTLTEWLKVHTTGRPRTYHKTIISLFPGVHRKTELNVFSWWRKVLVDNSNSPMAVPRLLRMSSYITTITQVLWFVQCTDCKSYHQRPSIKDVCKICSNSPSPCLHLTHSSLPLCADSLNTLHLCSDHLQLPQCKNKL